MRARLVVVVLLLTVVPSVAGAQQPSQRLLRRPAPAVAEAFGEGIVAVVPDQAILTLGVRTEGPTAREAIERNAQQMTAVLQALAAAGFSGPSVSTQSITVGPRYEYRPNEQPRLVGYEATNQIRLTATPTTVGPALDAAIQAGANLTGGLAFGLKDQHEKELEAIGRAVRDARERLDAMVGALGRKVTRVVEVRVVESGAAVPVMERFAASRVGAAAPTPVEPGQVSVRARVVMRAEF
jgi:uncharacterized protein YggE